ncbi:MAG: right-handed parallel beta-helix repeat-containing protein [Candidatus Altiarchaeota archaeon]|nr:right-handed parallel beta-helix repeat-containing protein [Candidatus Altiarchaeota archaeon]
MRFRNLMHWGLVLGLILVGFVDATTYNCSSCSDCNNKINSASAGDTVYLTANITDQPGGCIEFNSTGSIVFDCQGNSIDGVGPCYGIYLDNKAGDNTVRNCLVTGFYYGVYLHNSSYNKLINNTVNNNSLYGIYLSYSNNNNLTDNTVDTSLHDGIRVWYSNTNTIIENMVNNNEDYGIRISYSDNNSLIENTVDNNKDDGIKLLISSSNTLTRNTVNYNTGDGIYLYLSEANTITENTANNNYNGIYLDHQSNNTILTGNTVNNNEHKGIYLKHTSSDNTLNSNQVCYNADSDFYLSGGSGNSGSNNTCDTTYTWNDEGTTGCTYSCSNCTDSDGGKNYYEVGITNGRSDFCLVQGGTFISIDEHYCENGEIKDEFYQCPYGCAIDEEDTVLGRCAGDGSILICTDSDGGLDYYNIGEVMAGNFSNNDFCGIFDFNKDQLFEWTCEENKFKFNTYDCPNGCQDGACISACDLAGDNPPCGEITLSEVIDFINLWAQGQASLADVIDLINAWASG